MAVHSGTRVASGTHGMLPVASGGFVAISLNATTLSTGAGAAGKIDYTWFSLSNGMMVDQLSTYVTTGVAATTCRIGLYADNGAGLPGTLLADTGDLSTATSSAAAAGTITPVTLSPGVRYWVAIAYSGAPTLRAVTGNGLNMVSPPDGTGAGANGAVRITKTYGALASNPDLSAPAFLATMPLIRLRAA